MRLQGFTVRAKANKNICIIALGNTSPRQRMGSNRKNIGEQNKASGCLGRANAVILCLALSWPPRKPTVFAQPAHWQLDSVA